MVGPRCPPDVLSALPKGMASERLSRTSSWERMHFCVDASSVQFVPPLLAKHAQQRQCWSFGVCLCYGERNRTILAFLFALRRHLKALLRKESSAIRALRGPNEMREAADAGRLVVSVQDQCQVDIHYHPVSYVRYQPLRPVLLRMAIVRPLVGADAFELGARAGKILLRLAHACWALVLRVGFLGVFLGGSEEASDSSVVAYREDDFEPGRTCH